MSACTPTLQSRLDFVARLAAQRTRALDTPSRRALIDADNNECVGAGTDKTFPSPHASCWTSATSMNLQQCPVARDGPTESVGSATTATVPSNPFLAALTATNPQESSNRVASKHPQAKELLEVPQSTPGNASTAIPVQSVFPDVVHTSSGHAAKENSTAAASTAPPTGTDASTNSHEGCSVRAQVLQRVVVRVAHGDHTRPRLRKLGELHAPPLTCHPQRPSYKIHVHNKWRRPPRWLARQAQQASLWRLLSLQLAQSQAPASQQGWRRFHSWWWRPPDHPRR